MDAGFTQYWDQADAVGHATALLLIVFSLLSWATILRRLAAMRRRPPTSAELAAYWQQTSAHEGLGVLAAADRGGQFVALAEAAARAESQLRGTTRSQADAVISRELRTALSDGTRDLESGMTLLASIASTAPFVGLFGTVWGIHRALGSLAEAGAFTIERVVGPLGEALVMTAFGLAVAIPAALAYNAFVRSNRALLERLDGFAADLRLRAIGPLTDEQG
ncbi:MotA/TolQ/ExbB proton channel family protein [Derxia gummosa]|uniref:Biopolymer transport protein ExbB n=1 Tax=Derxia gummosa DSM 723 TaxID=1121388 RepID=A0A8B6X8V6_9BURK|nr:MotA/TolQ/ExbB proton channel family protein [Derxia gummosa]